MKRVVSLFALIVALSGAAFAQPVVAPGGIVNAASYIPAGLPNYGIAQGSLFIVMGEGLGPPSIQVAQSVPWPTELAGTRVQVSVGPATVNAYLYYSSDRQVAAVLPSNTPVGEGTLTVTYNGAASDPAPIRVVKSAFGIFSINQGGFGPGIVQNWYSDADLRLNTVFESARPGQAVIVWGTGLGPIGGNDADVPPVGNLDVQVEVFIGDRVVEPFYAGRTGMGVPSVDQVQFFVPEGIAGCRVPLAVRVNGVLSNYTTISVAPEGGVCSDPADFSAEELRMIQESGRVRFGAVMLQLFSVHLRGAPEPFDGTFENASAQFHSVEFRDALGALGLRGGRLTAPGSCLVYTYADQGDPTFAPDETARAQPLDAGPALTLTGPQGTAQLDREGPGFYQKEPLGGGLPGGEILPPFLVPGAYTLSNGDGGTDVGPFQAAITLPPMIEWTNREALSEIDRSRDLTITWQGGDDATQLVTIVGFSLAAETDNSASFLCTARPGAGRFVVPAAVLSSLPATREPTDEDPFPAILAVGVHPLRAVGSFTAPGLDFGNFAYVMWITRDVLFR